LKIKALSLILKYNPKLTTKRAGTNRPFFLVESFSKAELGLNYRTKQDQVALQEIVEQIVTGLGYDLVEIERSAGGLLRVTIDLPWDPQAGDVPFVNVEDCEKVTRQLQFALEVDGVEYKRLEVSSPGIDRPLRHEKDFERFVGHVIDITLKAPMGAAAAGQVSANRKKFRGTLERVVAADGATGWQIVWSDEPAVKPGQKISKKRLPAPVQALGFTRDELREARLAPIVSFKGRGAAGSD
jgi:ribosome maturation factor RimP